jgi:hypothetical protein
MYRTFLQLLSASFTAVFILTNHPLHGQERIKLDSKTPLSVLLPKQRQGSEVKLPVAVDKNLVEAPELMLHEPISSSLCEDEALNRIADLIAKINHLDKQRSDGFIGALRSRRADLKGLPFQMLWDGRTSEEEAAVFKRLVQEIHDNLNTNPPGRFVRDLPKRRATILHDLNKEWAGSVPVTTEDYDRAAVGATMQILATESADLRVILAGSLSEFASEEATRALARLAIFSLEEDVRSAAITGLKKRNPKHYIGMLMDGFRYPLPAVAQRAADALVKLERKELVGSLVKVLEEPDPRMPVKKVVQEKDVYIVRELVRVNHQRNCLLCHAPGNSPGLPEGVLKVPVPLPTEQLGTYENRKRIGIEVRLDITYLRQDFSAMLPAPQLERFDFLVRTRELPPQMAKEWEELLTERTKREFSAYHRAAAYALRELTGHDVLEPTAEAWRHTLRLAAP